MQRVAAEALNNWLPICAGCGSGGDRHCRCVIVSNTACTILLGLPVKQLCWLLLCRRQQSLDCKARDMGLRLASGAYVHFLPNIAGFVGGTMWLCCSPPWRQNQGGWSSPWISVPTRRFSLLDGDRISSVSCASGPAFEGITSRTA